MVCGPRRRHGTRPAPAAGSSAARQVSFDRSRAPELDPHPGFSEELFYVEVSTDHTAFAVASPFAVGMIGCSSTSIVLEFWL
jgi:hypothetical protein